MGKRRKGKGESVLGGISSLHVAVYLFIYFGCTGSLLLHKGFPLAAARGLLTAGLPEEHRLWGMWASVVAAHGLSTSGSRA